MNKDKLANLQDYCQKWMEVYKDRKEVKVFLRKIVRTRLNRLLVDIWE